MRKRLAIISTHPIQYNAPLFRLLAERKVVDVHVFYTWSQAQSAVYDPGFGAVREWDIPLLAGYPYSFVRNTAKQPGSHHFQGMVNPTLPEEVFSWKPDAILVYGWSFSSHLKLMRFAKRKGIPVWFRGDSNLLDEPTGVSWRKFARRMFLRWVFSFVSKAFYVGQANHRYFTIHGLSPERLVWAPHTIDNERFFVDTEQQEQAALAWRTELGISVEKPTFVFAGKLEAKKNVVHLVRAFLDRPQYQLVMVGNGKQEEEVRALAAGSKHIFFLPFQNQSQMPLVYRLGEVFVLPSVGPGETWGLALNEAMACARPVIAGQQCGGAADLVPDNRCGRITTGSVADIQRVVDEMAVADWKQMGANAKHHIQSFSIEVVAQAYEQGFA
jgi:glycosyltransferase involved in cell wall biosynthesis